MADQVLDVYAQRLREMGAIRSESVATAFATVPRHLFLPRLGPLTDEVVRVVYTGDDAIVTRWANGVPTSSSTQPSLMAKMLEKLDLAPGHRVLEIGTGTGYNAALIATITGAEVVSVDVQPDVVEEARVAFERAGIGGVRAINGDGYLGYPAGKPYDRIIATCGVGGLAPAWLDQLAPDGRIVAPVYHGGFHPTIAAWRPVAGGELVGQPIVGSDFMIAPGPLHPGYVRAPEIAFDEPPVVYPYPFGQLDWSPYMHLWFAIAVAEPAANRRRVTGLTEVGDCALVDDAGLVLVQPDAIRAFGASPQLIDRTRSLVELWDRSGRPGLDRWTCRFDVDDGLYLPAGWRLGRETLGAGV